MDTTITKKGQIVIPAKLRRKYGITAGTTIHVEEKGDKIVLTPITDEYIHNLRGVLKPQKKKKTALQVLKEERKADRIKEENR